MYDWRYKRHPYLAVLLGASITGYFVVIGAGNYPFFHMLADSFGVTASVGLFFAAWLGPWESNGYFRFVGAALLFVAPTLTLHVASYPGVEVLRHSGMDATTLMWALASGFVALGVVGAPFFIDRRVDWRIFPVLYVVWQAAMLAAFPLDVFDGAMWVDGQGVTALTAVAGHVTAAMLVMALVLHFRRRDAFGPRVRYGVATGISLFLISGVLVMVAPEATDFVAVLGHALQPAAFWTLFIATVREGMIADHADLVARMSASERRFRRLADAAPVGILESGADGIAVWANRTMLDMAGQTLDTLVGGQWAELIHPDDRTAAKDAWRAAVLSGTSADFLVRFRRPGGGIGHALVRVQPDFETGGRPQRFYGVVVDITKRVEAEQALERERALLEDTVFLRTQDLSQSVAELELANTIKDEFIANVRHELRTPLNSVIGFSGILRAGLAGPLNEEQQRQVEMISDAGKRLHTLIKDILYVSRIESGTVDLRPEEFDLAGVAEAVLESLRGEAERKGLALDIAAERLPAYTDPWAVAKVVGQLASNAIKFTERGGVHVDVSRQGDFAVLTVSDTGPGISVDDLPHVFDRFRQVRPADGGKVGGAGIGLSLSRALAEMLGGDVTIESAPGRGTTATLKVPLRIPQG